MNDSLNRRAKSLAQFRTNVHASDGSSGRFGRAFRWSLRSLLPSDSTLRQAGSLAVLPQTPVLPEMAQGRKFTKLLTWENGLVVLCLLGLLGLGWFSLHLAATRIYQVDECIEVYVAKFLVTSQNPASAGHVTLFQIILSWFLANYSNSTQYLASARFVMQEFFWLNIFLIALAAGGNLFSRRGLVSLVGAATLAPLWDYGFEVRHDNLLMTGLLLIWCILRLRPVGLQSYFIIGAISIGLEFVAFKSFVYTAPISIAAMIFPPPAHRCPRWKLSLAWLAGSLGIFLSLRILLGLMGIWSLFVGTTQFLAGVSSSGHRFGPGIVLIRLLIQTPLLLAVLAAGLVSMMARFRLFGKECLIWDDNLPEAILFLIAFLALLINPAPFPYNVLHLVPYAYIFAFRYGAPVLKMICGRKEFLPLAISTIIFAHFVPFWIATRRHVDWPNSRQEELIRRAEQLTDAVRDPVFDGIGMVMTRPVVGSHAFLSSLNIASFIKGPGPQVRDMLATNAAAVFIPNYRTDWLPSADMDFIHEHYVSLADDFWVLGNQLPEGGGTFQIIHPGRYRVSSLEGSDLAGTYPPGLLGFLSPEKDGKITGTLDGAPLPDHPIELAVGTHQIQTSPETRAAVVWAGPHLDRLHRLAPSDHRWLFVNWY